MDLKQFQPFAGFTLEDIIRHLAAWPLPDANQRVENELLVAILMLCKEWSANRH